MKETKPPGRGRGCWRGGCLACSAVVAVLVGLPLVLALIGAVMGRPDSRYETRELRRSVPAAAPSPAGLGDPEPARAAGSPDAVTETVELGDLSDELSAESTANPSVGRIRLDLTLGRFIIEPGPREGGIRIEADYDVETFDLTEDFGEVDGGAWSYELRLRSKIGWFRRIWGSGRSVRNEIRITLPRGVPFALEGELGLGETRADLGGLWLTEADLTLGTGEHRFEFSEPLLLPAKRLRLAGGVGELEVVSLGNASPEQAQIRSTVGEMRVDLDGAWRRDAELKVDFGVGECRLRAPADVRLRIDRAKLTVGDKRLRGLDHPEELPDDAPTLNLALAGTIGELNIERIGRP